MTTPNLPPPGTLAYSSIRPPRDTRPGVLTALAIVNIVIGGFGVLNGVGGVVSTVMLHAMGGMTFPAPVAAPPPPPPPVSAPVPTAATTTYTDGGTTVHVHSTAAVGTATPAAAFTTVRFGSAGIGTLIAGVAESVVRILLAGLLIAAGVLVLRDHRLGRSLHLWWAWLRLPVALIGGVVYWQMTTSMMRNFAAPAGAPVGAIQGAMVFGAVMRVVLACAYPVAVVIVLRTGTVRRYYAELSARMSPDRGTPAAVPA